MDFGCKDPEFIDSFCFLYFFKQSHFNFVYSFTHIYTRWVVADEDRSSEQISLENITPEAKINFKDHHAVPLANATASDIMAIFLEEPFCIEVKINNF